MLQQTRAIILRTIPYSETSLVVSALTAAFGMQQYLVKGARTVSKKGSSLSSMLQPGALLDLVVYHNDLKQLQIIREMKWAYVYRQVMANVTRNAVALYMVEILARSIREPETNTPLYEFAEAQFLLLDDADDAVVANLPLYFALKLAAHLGFRIDDNFDAIHCYLDLQEGSFAAEPAVHGMVLEGALAATTHALLQHDTGATLYREKLSQQSRRLLLQAYEHFYQYHMPEFGALRSTLILQEVLD